MLIKNKFLKKKTNFYIMLIFLCVLLKFIIYEELACGAVAYNYTYSECYPPQ